MKCDCCPFHLVCTMGRLGDPYELRLCPDCTCISFVVDQKYSDDKLQAHVFCFTCEKHPMTVFYQRLFRDAVVSRNQLLTSGGVEDLMDAFDPIIVHVADPGPGGQMTFHIRKCIACAGKFERAHQYIAVTLYNLDAGDALPKL